MNTMLSISICACILFFVCFAGVMSAASQSPVPAGAELEELATDFRFIEGPRWRDDGYLVFSDIPANTIFRWSEDGEVKIYRRPSGNSNGITEDTDGRLILAQHAGRVSRVERTGFETPLAKEFEGKRLNSPNDVVVKSDGSIYFTDPPYGVSDEDRELDFSGVFRLAPDGELQLLIDDFVRPNGITFSPDESLLYVNDSQEGHIRVFDVEADGSISNDRVFAVLHDPDASGVPDGMKVDTEGRVYSTGAGGIWIFSPDGEVLDRIMTPHNATNIAWGGENNDMLYITAVSTLYRIRLNATGIR